MLCVVLLGCGVFMCGSFVGLLLVCYCVVCLV